MQATRKRPDTSGLLLSKTGNTASVSPMASTELNLDGAAASRPHATPSLLATPSIPITLGNLRQYLEELMGHVATASGRTANGGNITGMPMVQVRCTAPSPS